MVVVAVGGGGNFACDRRPGLLCCSHDPPRRWSGRRSATGARDSRAGRITSVYVVYQQLQVYRIRRRLVQSEELFRLIAENAADMIAVIDGSA